MSAVKFVLREDTWPKMLEALKEKGYVVDSAYRRRPDKYITIYDDMGQAYMIEVTQYFRGDYELRSDNMRKDEYYEDVEASDDLEDYEDDESSDWKMLSRKSIRDWDGFLTEYALWQNIKDGTFACTYGDTDLYRPEDGTDFETENEDEAWEWFNSYQTEEDLVEESEKVPVKAADSEEYPIYQFGNKLFDLQEEFSKILDDNFGSEGYDEYVDIAEKLDSVCRAYSKHFG